MLMQTNDLTDAALDWAVAKAMGRHLVRHPMGPQGGHGWWIWEEVPSGSGGIVLDQSIYMEVGPRTAPKRRNSGERYSPSTDWAQGGPLIERERIGTWPSGSIESMWAARPDYEVYPDRLPPAYGPTPLIAACRCFVASKLGDIVDIPEDLI